MNTPRNAEEVRLRDLLWEAAIDCEIACDHHPVTVLCGLRADAMAQWLIERGVRIDGQVSDG